MQQSQIQTTTATNEVTVNLATGEAFISQTKAAAELGIARSSLQKWLAKEQVKYDVKQGLSSEILALAAGYYALDSAAATPEAKELLRKISQAGAKAWLYHEAGYVVSASPVKHVALPEDYVSALRALADKEEQRVLLLEENTEKHIETDSSDTHFTVRRVRGLNQEMKLDGKLLVKRSEELKVIVKQVFDLYEQQVNSYHRDIWLDVYPDVILP